MKLFKYEGKNLDELKNKAFSDLNASENELFLKIDEEVVGILKKKKYILYVLIKEDVVKYIKNYIYDITKYMGINVNAEIKLRDNMILINLFSEDCSVLIGKNGKTLESLQTLIKNTILVKTGIKINIFLDIENYKEHSNIKLESHIKKIAKEVKMSGIEVKLDPMNSFKRRIVHNAVSSVNGVSSKSEGEEPNRHVIIRKIDN